MKYKLIEEGNISGVDYEVSKTSYVVPYQKEVIVLVAVIGWKNNEHFEMQENFTASSHRGMREFIKKSKLKIVEVLDAQ